jgi:hypothetical protein
MLLVLKPFCDDLSTGMNSDLPKCSFARIDELVGNACRPDHNVPTIYFYRVITHSKGCMSLQDHKDLFIRMLVQFRTLARRSLHPEKRNGNASMFTPLKQMARELFSGNDVFHDFPPSHSSDCAILRNPNIACLEISDGRNDLTTDNLQRLDLVHMWNYPQDRLDPHASEPTQLPDEIAHFGAIFAYIKNARGSIALPLCEAV